MTSIIIISHQSTENLFAVVHSALRQQGLAELIIVDNGNTPDIFARLQQLALGEPCLKVIGGHGNVGLAKGCNIGARQASSEYLVFLKPDYLLPPDAIKNLAAALAADKRAMVAGGIIQLPDSSEQPASRHMYAFTPTYELLRPFKKSRFPIPVATQEIAALSSACFCVRASDYKKLGGLDELFIDQVQGIDFCTRVQTIGGKVLCVPEVKITCLPRSKPPLTRAESFRRAKGMIRYYDKHFGDRALPGSLQALGGFIMLRFALSLLLPRRGEEAHSTHAKRLMVLVDGLTELVPGESMKGKIVLVTGATSPIGLCVVRRLIASGAAVLALSRDGGIPFRHEQLRWITGDLSDFTFHLDGYCADMVVHCAPLWHLPPVLDLLVESEVKRIIAFSSTSVFAKLLSNNRYEKDLVEKLQSSEQLLAEKCTAKNIPYTILRPTLSYGAGLGEGITALCHLIERFGKVYVYPPAFGRRQPVHVDDLAVAVLQAADNPASYNKSYNLSGAEAITFRDMVNRLFDLLGKKTRIKENTMLPFLLDLVGFFTRKKHINGEIARRMNDDLVFFHDDAKRDFSFHPRAFLSGGIKDIEGF